MHVWIWVSNQYLENLERKLGNYNNDADFGILACFIGVYWSINLENWETSKVMLEATISLILVCLKTCLEGRMWTVHPRLLTGWLRHS